MLSEGDELGNGGAALSAYGRMQFTEMSNYERQELRKGLLKYCELDTMAMIMLFEGWTYIYINHPRKNYSLNGRAMPIMGL